MSQEEKKEGSISSVIYHPEKSANSYVQDLREAKGAIGYSNLRPKGRKSRMYIDEVKCSLFKEVEDL